MTVPPVEVFLADFHDREPGGSTRAFAGVPVHDDPGASHPSTYHALLAVLSGALPSLPIGPVRDLACGDGYLLSLMRSLQRRLIGVDLSRGELAAARVRLGPNMELVRARAVELPLATSSVAAITCHMALQLMDDTDSIIRELARVLRPGGELVVLLPQTPAPLETAGPARAAFIDALRGEQQSDRWRDVHFGERALCSIEGLRAALLPRVGTLAITTFSSVQQLALDELWQWFSGMYHRALLPAEAWARVRGRFDAAVAAQQARDGTLRLDHQYLLATGSMTR